MFFVYKVSVIIPVYGVEKYIERCARSLFEQTLEDIEYIFVDDCTQDNSMSILNKVLAQYPQRKDQVKIIKHEYNKGLPQARKTGIAACSGEYVAHCDSDDWVDTTIYQKMYETAINDNADIVCCDYYTGDENSKRHVHYNISQELLTGPIWNKLVRRALYSEYDIKYPTANKAEDGALMVQLSYYAKKICSIPVPLYFYYQNQDSICHVMTEEAMMNRLSDEIKNTDLRIDFIIKHGALEKYKRDVLIWKKTCRENLRPYCYKRKYLKLWRNTYPEINRQVLLDSNFSIYTKIVFLIEYFGLYICLLRLKNLIRIHIYLL